MENKDILSAENPTVRGRVEAVKNATNDVLKIGKWNNAVDTNPAYYGPAYSCGFPENRTDVDEAYIVTVTSSALGKRTIRALLQDDFKTSVKSTWAQPSVMNYLNGIRQEVSQAVTKGYALGSQFMTRRVWYGSSPMYLNILLKFESLVDAYKEVVLPCGSLQQLALPAKFRFNVAEKEKNSVHHLGESLLIVPPGPNPFYLSEDARKKIGGGIGSFLSGRQGDIVNIDIGKLISFTNVIVKDVEVTWGRRLTEKGYPINAIANVYFESFEIFTKEDINEQIFKETAASSQNAAGQMTNEQIQTESINE